MKNRGLERDLDLAKDTLDNLMSEIEELENQVEYLEREVELRDDAILKLEELVEELKEQIENGKTYRHRKTGYIATQLEKDSFIYKYDCGLPLSCYIKQEMLEDSCDWEKVIHKDYEILSFRANTGLLRIKDSNGIFQANGDAKRENTTEQYLLNEGGWDIYSVKRLSDGNMDMD